MLTIAHASVSVTGGIQPDILKKRLTKTHLANGLFARLLFAFPPGSRRWSRSEIHPQVKEDFARLLEELIEIPQITEGHPMREPQIVDLTPEAKDRFGRFVDEFGGMQDKPDDLLAASFAKLERYAARFALVLHLARRAEQRERERFGVDVRAEKEGTRDQSEGRGRETRAQTCGGGGGGERPVPNARPALNAKGAALIKGTVPNRTGRSIRSSVNSLTSKTGLHCRGGLRMKCSESRHF